MTEALFLDQPQLQRVAATVVAADATGITLDQTIFYARSGGQPGDTGTLCWGDITLAVTDTIKGPAGTILHLIAEGDPLPAPGTPVDIEIDWARRHQLMRMHTAMHLVCSLIKGAAVTGGAVGVEKSRLDFDLPDPPAKEDLEAQLNALITADLPVRFEWVDEVRLDEDPGLVRTMSVQPPRGTGRLRLLRIGADDLLIDLQPCGGTHVSHTGEIGPMRVIKIENKGRKNRRIIIAFAGES